MGIAEKFEVIADEVYEKGKEKEHNDFWDSFLARLGSADASNMFSGIGWNDNTFYPNRNINTGKTAVNGMFSRSCITNLEERFNSLGITLNTSRATKMDSMFYYCNQTEVIPVIDMSGVVETSSLTQMFYNCSKLQTIRKLIFPENMTASKCYNQMFSGCTSLANIEVEGNIVQTISFSSSPLTVESMKSIISCLKDYSQSDDPDDTLTFNDDCWRRLEASGSAPDGDTWENYVIKRGWLIG